MAARRGIGGKGPKGGIGGGKKPAEGDAPRRRDGKPVAPSKTKAAGDEERAKATRADAARAGSKLSDRLRTAASAKAVAVTDKKVEIDVPDLSGIQVHIPVPAPATDAEVDARIEALCTLRVGTEPRLDGELIAMGDQVLVDATGYFAGEVFSAQVDTWMWMEPNPILPGLFEGLVDTEVGSQTVVPLVLPADYPEPGMAGGTAAFAVQIKAARRRAETEVDVSDVLKELGYGETVGAARAAVHEELTREQADRMVAMTRQRTLDVIEERAPGVVPEEVIDAELQRRWRAERGEHLARTGADLDQQEDALRTYLEDAGMRLRARREIWERHLLEIIAEQQALEATDNEVMKVVVKAASVVGVRASDIHTALKADSKTEAQLVEGLRRQRALEHVLSQVEVVYVPAAS